MVNGDSDRYFSLNITSHSYEVTRYHANMSIHPSMTHGHGFGWNPIKVPEIYTFAGHILKDENYGLASVTQQPLGRKSTLKYESKEAIQKVTIYYLKELPTYRKEENDNNPSPSIWFTQPVKINSKDKSVEVKILKYCMTYYINLEDEHGHVISTILVEL